MTHRFVAIREWTEQQARARSAYHALTSCARCGTAQDHDWQWRRTVCQPCLDKARAVRDAARYQERKAA